ncbi:hypothetical protein T05_4365 [Trichinella murrelli]|uniref:Uncharacterized protein n=1 Tax=Trichinella murrelli TaxID=144512 RepID=A0A0V0TG07_9BILA|nr:hypothetical protein T05_4365 [Trichinella murrelli]
MDVYFFLDLFFQSNKDNNMWHAVKEENGFGKIDPSLRTDGGSSSSSSSSSSSWSPLAVTNLTSLFWKKRLWSFRLMLSDCRRAGQILFLAYGNGP